MDTTNKMALAVVLLCSTQAFTPLMTAQAQTATSPPPVSHPVVTRQQQQTYQQSTGQQAYQPATKQQVYEVTPAQQAPAAAGQAAQPVAEQQYIGKTTVSVTQLFPFNSARLSTPQPKLDQIASMMHTDPTITELDIIGYTDTIGSNNYNMDLSLRRAEAVRNYLVSKGVDSKRLLPIGRGEQQLAVECHDKKHAHLIACSAPNRRVELEPITTGITHGEAPVSWQG